VTSRDGDAAQPAAAPDRDEPRAEADLGGGAEPSLLARMAASDTTEAVDEARAAGAEATMTAGGSAPDDAAGHDLREGSGDAPRVDRVDAAAATFGHDRDAVGEAAEGEGTSSERGREE
jgi:hypothetical protein